jgi:hypothetical protein
MADLVGGRYPTAEEEWVLDGQPYPPYRRTMSRRDITSTINLTQAQLFVFAVPVQAGDIFNFVSLAVKTATSVGTHSWVALYNGVSATSTLLAQSSDVVAGFAAGNLKIQLNSTVSAAVPQAGTPQGPAGTQGFWSTTPLAGPSVLGVALYNSGTTGAVLDGMAGGAVAGEIIVAGQLALSSSVALAATATAPATLTGLAAAAGAVPYVVLSRQ